MPASLPAESASNQWSAFARSAKGGGVRRTPATAVLNLWVSTALADSSSLQGRLAIPDSAPVSAQASEHRQARRKRVGNYSDSALTRLSFERTPNYSTARSVGFSSRSLTRTIRIFIEMSRERELASWNPSGSEYVLSTHTARSAYLGGPLRIAFTRE